MHLVGCLKRLSGKINSGFIDKSFSLDRFRYYFYLIEVENPQVNLVNIKLSDEAYNLYLTRGLSAFHQKCGKEVVIGYKTGGYLYHLIKVSKKSVEDRTTIDQLIKASGFGFGLKGQLQSGQAKQSANLNFEVYSKWQGGKGEFTFTNIDDLRRMSEKWPETVANHGVILEKITMPYQKLIAVIDDPFYQIISNEIIEFANQLDRLQNIKKNYLKIRTINKDKVESISANKLDQLQKLITKLIKQIAICEDLTSINKCQNIDLLIKAQDFNIVTIREHPSCGVEKYLKKLKRDKSCGFEPEPSESVISKSSSKCPVEKI